MGSLETSLALSRRRLLQLGGATAAGLALGGAGALPGAAHASPISFGVGPLDRALDRLNDNGYQLRSAALALNDGGSVLVDGTERTRRVLYRYADQVGPWVDSLAEVAHDRARGRPVRYDRLLRIRRALHIYRAPVLLPDFYGLPRVFQVGEAFGFGLVPVDFPNPGLGRIWPAPGDFWGLAYAIGPQEVPVVWFMASTAEYRAVGPFSATQAVRTEVVAYRGGQADWMGYQASEAVLCSCLRRGAEESFDFPSDL